MVSHSRTRSFDVVRLLTCDMSRHSFLRCNRYRCPGTPVRRTSPSDTSTSDPDPQTDATTTTPITMVYRGNILVRNTNDNSVLGYISSTFSNGQAFYQDKSNALTVSFTLDSTGSGNQLNLILEVSFSLLQPRALPLLPCLLLECGSRSLRLLGSHPGWSVRS